MPFIDLTELVQLCFRIDQKIKRRFSSRKYYPNTFYSRREPNREGYSFKFKSDEPQEENRKMETEKGKGKEKYNYREFSSKEDKT